MYIPSKDMVVSYCLIVFWKVKKLSMLKQINIYTLAKKTLINYFISNYFYNVEYISKKYKFIINWICKFFLFLIIFSMSNIFFKNTNFNCTGEFFLAETTLFLYCLNQYLFTFNFFIISFNFIFFLSLIPRIY